MKNGLYLLNMSVSGIKNIKKEVTLNFYKKTVNKFFDPDRYRIKAIYGENGSGKSALITAVQIFQNLIMNGGYLGESKTQLFLNEMINKTTQTFRFSCEFTVGFDRGRLVYHYSVCLAKSSSDLYEIRSETLKLKNGNYQNYHYSTVFESQNGELLQAACSRDARKVLEKRSANLLSQRSFIYIYMMNTHNDFVGDKETVNGLTLHVLACAVLTIIIKVYLAEEDQHEIYFLKQRIKDSRLLPNELLEAETLADALSVNEKTVDKQKFELYQDRVKRLTLFLQKFKPDLLSVEIDAKEKGNQYECDLNLNYGSYRINKEFESTGIKKLIRLFDCFSAASKLGIVFIDEMDANLNDVYLCKLIEYFMYYGKGQLCFTTHNLDPMAVLKENKNSIDFLSGDNHLVSWTSRGNAAPENCYKSGMIEDSPFNIEATDFIGIFGE